MSAPPRYSLDLQDLARRQDEELRRLRAEVEELRAWKLARQCRDEQERQEVLALSGEWDEE